MAEENEELFITNLIAFQDVRAIYSYPHPLTNGGMVVLVTAGSEEWPDIVSNAYRHKPSGRSLYCIRDNELDLLSRTGIFAPPLQINELPHLPSWLQHKGQVHWGVDMRSQIPKRQTSPQMMLCAHLEGCRDTMRRYGILPLLLQEKYSRLIAILDQEIINLMATALLIDNIWDITLPNVPDLFQQHFPAQKEAWSAWKGNRTGYTQKEDKASTLDAIWHFEQFVLALQKEATCL